MGLRVAFALVLLVPGLLAGQPGTVTGRVTDSRSVATTGRPVSGI